MITRCAWHVHSHHSFDCFSSIADLLTEAHKNGIHVIAITDHGIVGVTQEEREAFNKRGIHFIQGCELTTDRGAHIVGLCVNADIVDTGRHPIEIGRVLIPHPFKSSSGLISLHQEDSHTLDYVFSKASMIEAYNANCEIIQKDIEEIYRIAEHYCLNAIATSDAHHTWKLAANYTEYAVSDNSYDPAHLLTMEPLKLVINQEETKGRFTRLAYRSIQWLWKTNAYQWTVARIPLSSKRCVKRFIYQINKCLKSSSCR